MDMDGHLLSGYRASCRTHGGPVGLICSDFFQFTGGGSAAKKTINTILLQSYRIRLDYSLS